MLLLIGGGLQASVGVKAGLSLTLAGQESAIYNPSTRIVGRVGAFLDIFSGGPVSLRSGIDLAMKGTWFYSVNHRAKQTVELTYLQLPLLLNLRLIGTGIDVFAGPFAGILIHSTDIDDDNDWTWEGNKVRGYDLGLSAGIRFQLVRIFFFELLFEKGLIDIVHDPSDPGSRTHRTTVISLLGGIRF